ncbi:MAG TPA: histidine kinase [Microscillaceae bacterium]|nr:histidine kinase [Microscillaceae bacterium]
MKIPEIYHSERERLANLHSYSILDTLPEEDFDAITTLAAQICGTSIALISLIDDKRQWFKSRVGLEVDETPKELAFCAHAINTPMSPMVVPDARLDARFENNPLVIGETQVIFYAGIPLNTAEGFPLGTLCVIDHEPQELSEQQMQALQALSRQVVKLLELRRSEKRLEKVNKVLEQKNYDLQQFAKIAAHDLKAPLNNIEMITNLLAEVTPVANDKEGRKLINMIRSASGNLRNLVDGLLAYYQSDNISQEMVAKVDLEVVVRNIRRLLSWNERVQVRLHTALEYVELNEALIQQILLNLMSNAFKYNDKEVTEIDVLVNLRQDDFYRFCVKDNGPGIMPSFQEKIFELFTIATNFDRFGNKGNGLGLATVQKLINTYGGQIWVASEVGEGATFTFTLPKIPASV